MDLLHIILILICLICLAQWGQNKIDKDSNAAQARYWKNKYDEEKRTIYPK